MIDWVREALIKLQVCRLVGSPAAAVRQNANHEIASTCSFMHSAQFSCCAEPHNCAFCCTLRLPSLLGDPLCRLFFLHATMNVVLCTGEIALLFSCQCSPRSVKTSKFEMKLSNKASQNTIKSSFFWFCSLPSRYNYNALKDASFFFSGKIVFNFYRAEGRSKRRRTKKRDFRWWRDL